MSDSNASHEPHPWADKTSDDVLRALVYELYAPVSALGEEIGVHLLVYDLDDLRGALKPDTQGRVPRGNLAALRRLMEKEKDNG